jgi:hypothetical protein
MYSTLAEAVGDGKFEVQPKVMPQWRALVLAHVMTWVCWLFGKKNKRGVVYVRSYTTGDIISEALNCPFYKAQADNKGAVL